MQSLRDMVPGLSLPSMSAGDTVSDPRGHELAFSPSGSESVNPIPDRLDNTPMPVIPSAQLPVNQQLGKYGAKGLPDRPANQSASVRPEGPQPSRDMGWTTGPQPGGNQGAGNAGAGDSGDGGAWGATPSFGPVRWGPGNSDA